MTTSTIGKGEHRQDQLAVELKRQRRFADALCRELHAELEALKRGDPRRLVECCEQAQAELRMIADVEQLRSGMRALGRDVFDLHAMARSAVAKHAFLADDHDVRLRCLVHRDAPRRVVGDVARLRRLLSDLVQRSLPRCAGGGLFVFVSRELVDGDVATVRFTICESEDGPPALVRRPLDRAKNPPRTVPWYDSAHELLRRMGGDLGAQAGGDGWALSMTVALDTNTPRPKRSELSAHAPILLSTTDQGLASAVGRVLQRCGMTIALEPDEKQVSIRLQQAIYSVVLMDRRGGSAAATFAARLPGSDDIRMVPILGVPRAIDGTLDEATLLHDVQQGIARDSGR